MSKLKSYDLEYKKQAVKLAKEIGGAKAAKELGISKNTIYTWVKKERVGDIDLRVGSRTPKNAISLAEEIQLS